MKHSESLNGRPGRDYHLYNKDYAHESHSLAWNHWDVTTTGHQVLMIPSSRLLFVWVTHIAACLFTLPLCFSQSRLCISIYSLLSLSFIFSVSLSLLKTFSWHFALSLHVVYKRLCHLRLFVIGFPFSSSFLEVLIFSPQVYRIIFKNFGQISDFIQSLWIPQAHSWFFNVLLVKTTLGRFLQIGISKIYTHTHEHIYKVNFLQSNCLKI